MPLIIQSEKLNRFSFFTLRSTQLLFIQCASAALLFLSNYILIHAAGEENYGKYVLTITWVNLFALFGIFGFDDVFLNRVPKQKKHSVSLYASAAKTVCKTLAISVGTIIICRITGIQPFPQMSWYFVPLLIAMTAFNLFISFRRATGNVVSAQISDKLLRPLLFVGFLLAFFMIFSQVSLANILVAQICMFVCMNVPNYFLFRRAIKIQTEEKTAIPLKTNLSFFLISLATMLGSRIDILFLSESVSDAELGHYNIACKLTEIIGYSILVMNAWLPVTISEKYGASTGTDKNIFPLLIKASVSVLAVIVAGFLVLLFFGRYILEIFGTNFQNAYAPALILAGVYFFQCFSAPLNAALMVSGRQKFSLISLLISTAVIIGCCHFLIPAFGLNGAAISLVCGSFVFTAAVYTFFFMNSKTEA